MKLLKFLFFLMCGLFAATIVNAQNADKRIVCQFKKVCRDTLTLQPLRILPRALSHIYEMPRTKTVKVHNVQAFYPLFVFERKDLNDSDPSNLQGWYQIGRTHRKAIGWMQAKDVIEWRHALIVSYTHPGSGEEKRSPVIWFMDKSNVKDIVELDDDGETVSALYQAMEKKQFPDTVIVTEPKKFLDIFEDFYVIPVIDFEELDINGEEALYVKLVAAHPTLRGGSGDKSDTITNPDYVDKIFADGEYLSPEKAQNLGVDIVFVIDMTRSMGPYMDDAKKLVDDIISQLNDKVQEKIKFGLVGYRDSIKHIPTMGFTAKNFTPMLIDAKAFKKILETKAKATKADSDDYAEELFAGVELALNSNWRDDTLRLLIIIGDASSHPVGHRYNTTGKDQYVLRQSAIESGIHINAVYLKAPRFYRDHQRALEQFLKLSQIQGDKEERSAFVEVNTRAAKKAKAKGESSDYDNAVSVFVDSIGLMLEKTQKASSKGISIADVTNVTAEIVSKVPHNSVVQTADFAVKSIVKAALIEYVGKDQNPPKDIQGWTLDRDMLDPSSPALRVHVLITKDQLNTLTKSLRNTITAFKMAEKTQQDFFDALKAIAAQTAQNPGGLSTNIYEEQVIYDILIPRFLQGLPYKSDIAEMTNDRYEESTPDERSRLVSGLEAKLRQYVDINNSPDKWIDPTGEQDAASMFYPLSLEYLP